jgi:putative nucleotidyltransferase with HDIG domain
MADGAGFECAPRYSPVASAAIPARSPAGSHTALAGAVLALPILAVAWLFTHPASDPSITVPFEHFAIVSAVSILAFVLAVLLAIAAMQIAQYRALFLCLGFMCMGGIFAVHGLETPGILGDADDVAYAGQIVGVSAYLSLFAAAVFFAASYTPVTAAFERRLPFSPAGWVIVVVGTALAAYAGLALLGGDLVASLPFGTRPYSFGLAAVTIGLLLFSAARQARAYLVSRVPLQAWLIVAFLLLAEAQVIMVVGTVWKLSWWGYHGLMLASVAIALWSIAAQRARGQSLRSLVEATLELEVKVGTELEQVDTIAALAAAVEARDENTKGHNLRVAELAVQIGRAMELPNETLRTLARAGLLHDVGKIGIPDSILSKPGSLEPGEWTIIKKHPELGHEILSRVDRLRREAQIVVAHHERLDGSGYPRGLRGQQIPLEARILAVADTYDVLVSDRPYRKAFDRERAYRILREECGTHLWEPAVRALFRSLGERWDRASEPNAA